MSRNQFSVRVVDDARDFRLMLCVSKENIRRRERDDFDIDADAIHVFETLRDIGHRRRHTKEARAAISDDCLARRTLVERKL